MIDPPADRNREAVDRGPGDRSADDRPRFPVFRIGPVRAHFNGVRDALRGDYRPRDSVTPGGRLLVADALNSHLQSLR